MKSKRYFMTHDCPHCGEKDEEGTWKGARTGSSRWAHSLSACSTECGLAFEKTYLEKIKTAAGRKWLKEQWIKFQSQSDARLCGEPYPGYDAENLLKSLGR